MNVIETTLNVRSNPDWKPVRGLCEILANAIDTMKDLEKNISDINITYTKNVYTSQNGDNLSYNLSIRDYGTGLSELHLTTQGKSSKRGICHKSGFNGYHGKGLLESCAVLKREGFDIKIKSQYLYVKVILTEKDNIAFKNLEVGETPDGRSFFNWFSMLSSDEQKKEEGTEIIISHKEDFAGVVGEMENEFIYFKNSKGNLVESTKFGNIYLSQKGERGRLFVYGFRIQVENGICQDCYYTYDFYDCPEIDKAIRNTESGNNRRLTSRKISVQLHKIHEDVHSSEIIKKARKYIKSLEFEFKDKVTQKKYSEKKICVALNIQEDIELPTLKVNYVRNDLSDDEGDNDVDGNFEKCIINLENIEDSTIEKLKQFFVKYGIGYKFV